MTLEQSTLRTLAAAEAQDLAALQAASEMRESALAALASIPLTPALHDAVTKAIAAGEEAKRAIQVVKQRIRSESRRLANIESGFVRALGPAAHRVDCRG